MQFETLDTTMRVFETAHNHAVLPGLWMVARLDGRNVTRLVREVHSFAAPFDERFHNMMGATTRQLMPPASGTLMNLLLGLAWLGELDRQHIRRLWFADQAFWA